MKISFKKGIGFGLTSGIITTLGLLIGLYSSNANKLIILGGIITIAIADALSDALGMHISEESTNSKTKDVWQATYGTFLSKLLLALTFIIPILLFSLFIAVVISILYGILILSLMSWYIAKKQKEKPFYVISEHLTIATLVIILTYFVGYFVSLFA